MSKVEQYQDDDEGYFRWLTQHPAGLVVNCYRKPKPRYLVLHRATCAHIQRTEGKTLTCSGYKKVCATEEELLQAWADGVGGPLRRCSHCKV